MSQGAVDRLTARFENTSDTIAVPAVNIDLLSLVRLAAKDELKFKNLLGNITDFRTNLKFLSKEVKATSHLDTVELGGKKYFFSKKQHMTWIDAVSFCRLYGMELTSIETREEEQLIAAHLKSIGIGGKTLVYTSGNKIGRSSYMWMNGKPLVYENWYPGEPASYTTQHCLAHYDGGWIDYDCHTNPNSFICEEP
ncbi:hypothetical protein B566_EDAN012344 [Ephemera danica]|nr:hypothetical protein B566_EDAN012344 [Ephemera danica]